MQYLRIRNKGTLDRILLELIGFSKKKGEDTGKIGFKGSGAKLAAIAAVRAGLDTAITSSDEDGDYFLRFGSCDVRRRSIETERVVYHYAAIDAFGIPYNLPGKSMDFVVDAFADWSLPIGDDGNAVFKIVREHVCNAYDEDPGFHLERVDERDVLFACEGQTCVYLAFTPEVESIFRKPNRYFKFLADRLERSLVVPGYGEIWERSDKMRARLFIRGVLAHCSAEHKFRAVFDYSLTDRYLLSEDRRLTSEYDFRRELGRMLMRIDDAEIVRRIFAGVLDGSAQLERASLDTLYMEDVAASGGAERWLRVVHEVCGTTRLAVASQHDETNTWTEVNYDHLVLGRGDGKLCRFLQKLGVPSADAIVPNDVEKHVVMIGPEELTRDEWDAFRAGFRLIAKHDPEFSGFPVGFFRPKEGCEDKVKLYGQAGFGDRRGKEILLNAAKFENAQSVYETYRHEALHCEGIVGHNDIFIKRLERLHSTAVFRQEGLIPDDYGNAPAWGDPDIAPNFIPVDRDREPIGERDTLPGVDLTDLVPLPESDD